MHKNPYLLFTSWSLYTCVQWHVWRLCLSTRQKLDKQGRIGPGTQTHWGRVGPINEGPCPLSTDSFHHHQPYHQALLRVNQFLPKKHRILKQTNALDIYSNPPLCGQGYRKCNCRTGPASRIPVPSPCHNPAIFQIIKGHWEKRARSQLLPVPECLSLLSTERSCLPYSLSTGA